MTQGNVNEYLLELQTILSMIETSIHTLDKCKDFAKNIQTKHSEVATVMKSDGQEHRVRKRHTFTNVQRDIINAQVNRIWLRLEEISDIFQFESDVFVKLKR